jgi:hypothetical protein
MKKLIQLFLLALAIDCHSQDSLFLDSEKPAVAEEDNPVELGMVFQPKVNGLITHFRFYKTVATDASQFTLNLWNAYGTNAIRQKVTVPGKVGWIRVALTTPVKVTAGSHYVVSVHFPAGRYGGRTGVFSSARTRGNLTAPSSTQAGGNGRYLYSATTGFPSQSYSNSAYFVDIVFSADSQIRKPLIVNAGRDTILICPIDSFIASYKLNGFVSGDEVTFSWRKDFPLGLDDTMINTNTLTPTIQNLYTCPYQITLIAKDKWGTIAEHQVTIDVLTNPKQVVMTLFQEGKPFIEIYQDGSWRFIPTSTGTWYFKGVINKGFEGDVTDEGPPPG